MGAAIGFRYKYNNVVIRVSHDIAYIDELYFLLRLLLSTPSILAHLPENDLAVFSYLLSSSKHYLFQT